MKWKLLFCAAALLVAGCAPYDQGSFAGSGEYGFNTDLVPAPVDGLTSADVEAMYGSPVVSPSGVSGQNY